MKYCKFLYLKTVHWTVVLKISFTLHLVTYNDSFFFSFCFEMHINYCSEKKRKKLTGTYLYRFCFIVYSFIYAICHHVFVAFTFCGCHVSLVVSFKVFSTSYSVLSLSILYASFVQSAGKHFGLTPAVLQNSYTNKSDFVWLDYIYFVSQAGVSSFLLSYNLKNKK